MKKTGMLAILIAVLMLVSVFPIYTFAEKGVSGDNLSWEYKNGVLTISGEGEMSDYVKKQEPWYAYAPEITSVVVKPGITHIGEYAFFNFEKVQSITLPDTVTSIGMYAFDGCFTMPSFVMPDSVTDLGMHAFSSNEELKSIKLSSNLKAIYSCTFSDNKSLTEIEIPESVKLLDERTFLNCSMLEKVVLHDGLEMIYENCFSGCSVLTDITIPATVYYIGYGAFTGTPIIAEDKYGSDGALYLGTALLAYTRTGYNPSCTIAPGTTVIGSDAFFDHRSMTSVSIPQTVLGIGDEAFKGCNQLEGIVIPESVRYIGDSAFYNCAKLEGPVRLSSCIRYIGERAFYGCSSIKEVEINNILSSFTAIKEWCFRKCTALEKVSFTGKITSIETLAFDGDTALREIRMDVSDPSSFSIAESAFASCDALSSVYFTGNEDEWKAAVAASGTGNTALTAVTAECTGANIEKVFKDVKNTKWFADGVRYTYEAGMIQGMTPTTFGPSLTMTRAMLVTVLYRLAGGAAESGAANPFKDVKSGTWYTDAVIWAYENDIVNGMTADTFVPNGNVTREQIATILYRYNQGLEEFNNKTAEFYNFVRESRTYTDDAVINVFPDRSKVHDYAEEALIWAVTEGIIAGNSTSKGDVLDPRGNATRAQVATMLARFCRYTDRVTEEMAELPFAPDNIAITIKMLANKTV